jgi:hypothetical protein
VEAGPQVSQNSQAPDEASPRLWIAPAALATSLVAVGCAAALCSMVIAARLDWHRLPWLQAPGSLAGASIVVWLVAALSALGLGVVSLLAPGQRRLLAVVAVSLSAASLLVVPVTAVGDLLWLLGPHHPSDSSMIGDFQQHESQFQQAMAAFRSGGDVSRFRSLGIETDAIDGGPKQGLILLPVSTWGLVPSGSAKGYAYSPAPLRPTTAGETDQYWGDMPEEIVYRHIGGPWYVYYESW